MTDASEAHRLAGRRWPRPVGWSRCASPAARCSPPSRTSDGCATPSGFRCRPEFPLPSPTGWPTRSATWSAGSPAPTARSSPATSPVGTASASRSPTTCCAGSRTPGGSPRVSSGPGAHGTEWCDAEVLRRIRRRSLARARAEVEPVEQETLARFLPVWQNVGSRLRGVDGVLTVVEQLAGCPVPASALEPFVLSSRLLDYQPPMLDELTSAGEVVWAGRRRAAGHRWLGHPASGRHRAADAARPRRGRARRPAPRRARGAGLRWRVLLPPARRRRGVHRRPGPGGRALGPDLGRPPDQRHDRPAARPARRRRRHPPTSTGDAPRSLRVTPWAPPRRRPAGPAVQDRSTDHGRPLGADSGARRRRDPPRTRHRRVDARAPRHRHPRRRRERAGARRLRGRLQGAVPVRGVRPLPPRLLRRRPGCRAVLHRRRRRPDPGHVLRRRAPHRRRRSAPRASSWPPPTPRTRSGRRCPGPTGPSTQPTPVIAPGARRARSW